MSQPLWESDEVQFPRLLAEIFSSGLTSFQYEELNRSTGLTRQQVNELLLRANTIWEKHKSSRSKSSKEKK